jgi:hypothetical protein
MSLRVEDHAVSQLGQQKAAAPERAGRSQHAAEFADLLQGLVKGQRLINTPTSAGPEPSSSRPLPPATR